MTNPMYYRIQVRGHLSDQWQAWFDGLALENQANGDAVLSGPISDQAALHGILHRIRDLGLTLVALNWIEDWNEGGGDGQVMA